MRTYLNRAFAIGIIIGLALIGRGVDMPHPVLLWLGILLSAGNTLLLVFSLCHSTSGNRHDKTTPLGDT
jgi:hypothetical protein